MKINNKKILVTGGAGYVGSKLVPALLNAGHNVNILDLYLYGDNIFEYYSDDHNLTEFKGDIRNIGLVEKALTGCDIVIHLACISNDPSFDLNPRLGKSINLDAFRPLIKAAKRQGVKRFVYASSSSVYGIKSETSVTENLDLEPLTDYSKYKALCENILAEEKKSGFTTLIIRPATICGYTPRLRLDLTVNTLTNHAINNGKITVFGGSQTRANIHVDDMVDLYLKCMTYPDKQIDGMIFNAGLENLQVINIAEMVRDIVGTSVKIDVTKSDDLRSYHISSTLLEKHLGFKPKYSVSKAIEDLIDAFDSGKIPEPMTHPRYYNLRMMQHLSLV